MAPHRMAVLKFRDHAPSFQVMRVQCSAGGSARHLKEPVAKRPLRSPQLSRDPGGRGVAIDERRSGLICMQGPAQELVLLIGLIVLIIKDVIVAHLAEVNSYPGLIL